MLGSCSDLAGGVLADSELQDLPILQWHGIASELSDAELWTLEIAKALHLAHAGNS